MTYDIDFRFRLALNPEGLTTIETTMNAIGNAIDDARNAGSDPENDPAVRLLARHLGRIAQALPADARYPEDGGLRRDCLNRIDALDHQPAIVVLARRDSALDAATHALFCREAEILLRALAVEFGGSAEAALTPVPGYFGKTNMTLATPKLFVRVTTDLPRPGAEVEYRRNDRIDARSRTADVAVLLDPAQFARRIARELDITREHQAVLA